MRVLVILSLMLTGCTALTSTEGLVSTAVTDYCAAPDLGRKLLRDKVAEVLKPNSIQINCVK